MKRLIPCILLLIFFSARDSYGQKIRFTDTSNKWTVESVGAENSSTLINYFNTYYIKDSITYVRKTGLSAIYRDDTLLNKVMFSNTTPGTPEYVYFDYSLQINDVLALHFSYTNQIPDTGVVYKIDSVSINGIWHKRWYLNGITGSIYSAEIIEGLGVYKTKHFEKSSILICLKNNHNVITAIDNYGSDILSPATCAAYIFNSIDNKKDISISPNPANQYSKITFANTIQAGTLTITDILGRRLVSKSIINQTAIPIVELPAAGVYFYTITDNYSGNKFAGRFVYQ